MDELDDKAASSEKRLHSTLESLLEGAQIIDRDWRYVYVNPTAARHGGRLVQDLVGRTMLEAYPGIERTAMFAVLERSMESGVAAKIENEFAMPDGASKWFELVIQPVPEGLFILSLDITDRKRAEALEQQFIRAQRMESIGMLAGGIAHDLNNILMPIVMGVSILRRIELDERSARTIDGIERSAKRGADLVKQLLSFVRGMTPSRTAVVVRDVVAEVEPIITSTFPKNITLRIEVPSDLHSVTGDATQLIQVLLNLCINARDAMPDGGRITIAAGNALVSEHIASAKHVHPGRYVRLEVADEGTGMSQDVLPRIFDPFFTTKERGSGTGLGLPTVQEIVRGHGGFTDVSSEVGRGTTFRVFVPAHAGQAQATEESMVEDLPRGNGETVMIVDDEITILNVTKQMLETFGYETIVAEDGAQAIAQYARHQSEISVVVTDMMMPVVEGPALIAALLRMNPALHVIATSGTSSHDWMARAERAGAKHFLVKPYTAPRLLRMLADLLRSGGRR